MEQYFIHYLKHTDTSEKNIIKCCVSIFNAYLRIYYVLV